MRIEWLFGSAAVVLVLFGLALLIAPGQILGVYGLAVTPDGEVVARLLGGQLLGYVPLELYALLGGPQVRAVNLRSIVVAEVTGLGATLLAALQGRGNTLFWGVVAIFLVFSIWRGFYALTYRPGRVTTG